LSKIYYNTIGEALDVLASAYQDDIVIYSNSEEEHEWHVKWIIQGLLEARLYLKPAKYKFHKETLGSMGLSILIQWVPMDDDMIEMVNNWSRECKTKNGRVNNVFEVQ